MNRKEQRKSADCLFSVCPPAKYLFLIFINLPIFFNSAPALAIDFLFNPMVMEGSVAPGTTETAVYQLWSQDAKIYEIKIEQAWPLVKPGEKNPYPVSEWLHFPGTEITVGANSTTTIPFTASARPDAKGEVAAYLTVRPSTKKQGEGSTMGLGVALGPTLYVTFRGTEEPRGELKDFGWIYNDKEQTTSFQWKVKSTGNVHLRPREEISIRSDDNKQEIKKILITARTPAFPGQIIDLSENLKLPEIEDPGAKYLIELKVFYGEMYDKPDLVWTASKRGRLNQDVK